jgi:peptidoglycan/xylan/chitin deacetylase (PgdA/CDA1 family)
MLEWLKRIFFSLTLVVLSHTAEASAEPSVSILMYHHVSESTPRSTSVSPDELRAHLQYLDDNGFTIVSLHEALAGIEGEQSLPDKAVVLTFDDAYQNIYQNGHPILQAFDAPYTLFVTTDPVGETAGQYMSWDQIRELHEDGVTIANHTQDHAHMPRRRDGESEAQWRDRMAQNIQQAEQKILEEVGVSHKLFAYPYGEYDNELADLVGELGFTGFGQHSGAFGPSSDRRTIPRFAAAGAYANLDTLKTKMAALAFPVVEARYDDTLLRHDETRPGLELELEVRDFRRGQVSCFIGGQPQAVEWLNETTLRIQAPEAVNVGRSRYNCTAPSISKPGRYYWYSIQWIREDEQGSWPD